MTQEGDGNETRFTTLLGVNGEGGNSNVMLGVEWYKREAVYQKDRDFSATVGPIRPTRPAAS